ncbi:hypothetical protein ACFO0N_20345 [Halobium salinum]|uniref:NrS-1 polymerase-like HBD domain-containing protein n=1 Tax=Halobium salinum TaxID=1364940 RepID=A0ABD5PHR8_9EURY|nr:hypothetical protein [Halobium salinum]
MSEREHIDRGVLPTALVERDQWVCWNEQTRDGKPTKIPITPRTGGFASSTDRDTWTDFETAVEYAQNDEADGLGFVFTDNDPFVGVDLDDCRDPETGHVDDDARDIVNRLDSYTEVSPSGTGFHVLVEGELPEGRNRTGSVEMYDSARFFTMTGDRVDVTPQTVEARQEALAEVHREYVRKPSMASGEPKQATGTTKSPTGDVDLTDEELIEKAQTAANGEKFDRLWGGDIHGYESQSEADMALCCLLAFWTGGDPTRVDRLFRESGLIRPKWDEQHFADGATYGERTIERAIGSTTDFFEPTEEESDHSDTRGQPKQPPTTEVNESIGTPQTGADEQLDSRERVYLKEQNQILSAKLEQQAETIEQQQEQIESLEAEIAELRASSASTVQEQTARDQEVADEPGSAGESIWEKAKRLVGGGRS